MTPLPIGACQAHLRIEGVNNFCSRPQLQQVINQSSGSAHRRREQLVQIGVKLREQLWVHAEQAEMSADALQRTELASRDQTLLDLSAPRRQEPSVTNRPPLLLRHY